MLSLGSPSDLVRAGEGEESRDAQVDIDRMNAVVSTDHCIVYGVSVGSGSSCRSRTGATGEEEKTEVSKPEKTKNRGERREDESWFCREEEEQHMKKMSEEDTLNQLKLQVSRECRTKRKWFTEKINFAMPMIAARKSYQFFEFF